MGDIGAVLKDGRYLGVGSGWSSLRTRVAAAPRKLRQAFLRSEGVLNAANRRWRPLAGKRGRGRKSGRVGLVFP